LSNNNDDDNYYLISNCELLHFDMSRFGRQIQTFHRNLLQPPSRQNCAQCRRVKTGTGDKTVSHKHTVKIQRRKKVGNEHVMQDIVVACLCNNCCHGKATKSSLCIAVDLHAAVFMQMQELVPFTLLSSYKIFHTADNNRHTLRSSC